MKIALTFKALAILAWVCFLAGTISLYLVLQHVDRGSSVFMITYPALFNFAGIVFGVVSMTKKVNFPAALAALFNLPYPVLLIWFLYPSF